MIELAGHDALEAGDRVLELDVLAGEPGELLGHEEWLGKEPGDAPRPRDDELVLFAQLVHAQNRDDILERLVTLENALHPDSDVVMAGPHKLGIEDAARAVERIHGRIDAELRYGPGEH